LKQVVIIGGGLSGLIAAYSLAAKNIFVTVIEKRTYPFHRVCGEYVSNETVPFLKKIGLYPEEFNPPFIDQLQLTSVSGREAVLNLDLGGFGISRYVLDQFIYEKAKQRGVKFYLDTEVEAVLYSKNAFSIQVREKTFYADVVIGSFGKRSKLDTSLKREFIRKRSPYVGIKYHIRTNHPANRISLHNFKDGYCGISNIEDGKSTLCYLTHRDSLKRSGTIKQLEESVLYRNPFLKSIFTESQFLFEKPEVVNEISFEAKGAIEDHILMSGDAAGMITPLCGNGMAMAIHAAKTVSEQVAVFCDDRISREEMERRYAHEWNTLFSKRLWAGRQIQKLFGNEWASNLAVDLARYAKPVAGFLVKKTHGTPF
jgi:menaquinone-9 beta-reductase